MIIEPKIRGFICTTAHPEGCAANVQQQIEYVKQQEQLNSVKNVLIIGCSTGYGLASRIVAAQSCDAATLGVMFEKPASGKRTASAGWYNTAAFEDYAAHKNLYATTINGDAFSDEIKATTIATIKQDMPEGIDLIIYSLASPRRTDPIDGVTYNSSLKTLGEDYTEKTVDVMTGTVKKVSIAPGTEEEISNTVKVMGGEDWERWIEALYNADVLAENVQTIAYTYIGPEITYPIYRHGTIGKAKQHLEKTAKKLQAYLQPLKGKAIISVNKAVVTQASSAIPVVPLYAALLYKLMKQANTHEDCIEQIYRLFKDYICSNQPLPLDENGFIRLDDLELAPEIQEKIKPLWSQVNSENIANLTDLNGYQKDFYRLFGFGMAGVNYQEETEADMPIRSLKVD